MEYIPILPYIGILVMVMLGTASRDEGECMQFLVVAIICGALTADPARVIVATVVVFGVMVTHFGLRRLRQSRSVESHQEMINE